MKDERAEHLDKLSQLAPGSLEVQPSSSMSWAGFGHLDYGEDPEGREFVLKGKITLKVRDNS